MSGVIIVTQLRYLDAGSGSCGVLVQMQPLPLTPASCTKQSPRMERRTIEHKGHTDLKHKIGTTPSQSECTGPDRKCSRPGGWRDDSQVKSAYCSSRGPELEFQHPYQAANNCLKLKHQFQGVWYPLLTSSGTSSLRHQTHNDRQTNMQAKHSYTNYK